MRTIQTRSKETPKTKQHQTPKTKQYRHFQEERAMTPRNARLEANARYANVNLSNITGGDACSAGAM
jgi:hypothetical protein